MSTPAARVAPGNVREAGLAVSGFARLAGRVTGTEPPGVFLPLGRHRRLFWGWLLFAGSLMPGPTRSSGGLVSGCCCGSPTSCTLGRTSRTPPGPTCGPSSTSVSASSW
ncbi:MAG: hypothetical protein ABWZ91_00530 [Nocardioides sp.]